MNKTQKRQSIAALLTLSMLIGGTFAWQSFDQKVTNETAGVDGDVGARLHNDFNGTDADVYVENYASASGTTLYTRVRLQEYMELGTHAGLLEADLEVDQVKNTAINILRGDTPVSTGSTPDINDKHTWDVYLHQGNSSLTETIRDYRTINYGDIDNSNKGAKVYMPTFNKDFDSTTADIKGSLGDGGSRYDGVDSYSTYRTYTIGEVVEGEASYNPQSQVAADQGSATVTEEHTARYTQSSYVITMAEWEDQGYPIGTFWVYDTDGWAYWAQGLAPETATGLLVDGITPRQYPDTDYYYGLHVVAQTASRGDWGTPEAGSDLAQGMYEDGITSDGLYLLNLISDNLPEASDIMFMSMMEDMGEGAYMLASTPVCTLGGHEYYIIDQRTVVSVDSEGYSQGTVDATLLWAKEPVTTASYHAQEQVSWEASYMRNQVLPNWLATQPGLEDTLIRVPVVTDGYYQSPDSYQSTEVLDEVTYDKIFLLSQMEFLATYGLNATAPAISSEVTWLRSPAGDTQMRYIDGILGTISTHTLSTTDMAGVRPAFWVASDKISN